MTSSSSYESDVVVIGGGIAGIAAALELLDRGKRVVLLEVGPRERFGGLALRAFGGLFFVDSPEQRLWGIEDNAELALADWFAYGELGPDDHWPRRWAEAYVRGCTNEVRGWLHQRGVRFFPAVNWTERGYYVPGNSVPRFHLTWGTGPGIVAALLAKLAVHEAAGRLACHFEHRVEGFDQQAGRFTGCHGRNGAGEAFLARGDALVLACGGIAGDLDRVRALWPERMGTAPQQLLNGSHPDADGKLLDAVAAHGGQLNDLDQMWNYAAGVRHWQPRFPDEGLSLVPGKSALWLDYRGRRFVDPPLVGSYDTLHLVERICREQQKYSWQVMNLRIARRELAVSGAESNAALRDRKLFAFLTRIVFGDRGLVREFIEHCPDFVTAGTLVELADKMNALAGSSAIDAQLLGEEVARYDANVARPLALQNDDQLRRIAHARQYRGDRLRTCKNAKILDPKSLPLIAIRLQMLTRKSLGGLLVDAESRVLDAQGAPLAGLYAVGEAAGFGGGGMHGKRALEGTFIGGCIFSGRMAARAIASGESIA
jgi:predicted oxidoreductase